MYPDTLLGLAPVKGDTQALQLHPPPLIPSHPTGLRGCCHNVVMMPEH